MSKKFKFLGIVAVLALVFIVAGCSDQQKSPVEVQELNKPNGTSIQCVPEPPQPPTECEPTVWDLTAGQHIVVGTVTVNNDVNNVYVTYELDYSGACFGTLHAWVGDDLADVPSNKKEFPYQDIFRITMMPVVKHHIRSRFHSPILVSRTLTLFVMRFSTS
jgi:hypothetical protein